MELLPGLLALYGGQYEPASVDHAVLAAIALTQKVDMRDAAWVRVKKTFKLAIIHVFSPKISFFQFFRHILRKLVIRIFSFFLQNTNFLRTSCTR